jgi:hypothetical protein
MAQTSAKAKVDKGQKFPFKVTNPHPFNPFASDDDPDRGNEKDDAYYVLIPGVNFWRPWIRVPSGPAFVWPLGVEGFNLTVEPQIGVHRYIGDNAVVVDVTHKGEERFNLSGNLPGDSASENARALRDVVYADTPRLGKIIFIPGILPYAQRVVVASFNITRADDDRGEDLTYSLDVVRIGYDPSYQAMPQLGEEVPQPTTGKKTAAKFTVTAKYNTLRKIAVLKKRDWNQLYNKNEKFFNKHKVPFPKVPDYKMPLGTKVYL